MEQNKPLVSVRPGEYPVHTAYISEPKIGLPDVLQEWDLMNISISPNPVEKQKVIGSEAFAIVRTVGDTVFVEPIITNGKERTRDEKLIVTNREVLAVPLEKIVRE